MPLNASSPTFLHLLQNLTLILLSLLFTPLLTLITILSTLLSRFHPKTHQISQNRLQTLQCRKYPITPFALNTSPSPFRPKTILVTGLGMSKGLTIARALHLSGHTVHGADFEPWYLPVCGRFSSSLYKFHRLTPPQPSQNGGAEGYIDSLLTIIRNENVDLWISCSGVASAIEDGEAMEVVERETGCTCVQFNVEITGRLHEKDRFIEWTRELGLNVPETYPVRSVEDALAIIYPPTPQPPSPPPSPEKEEKRKQTEKKYILKFTGTDDTIRADMTLLPLPSRQETSSHLAKLSPSPLRPFVLQQFIQGQREYCTHSLSIRGRILIFTAARSSELLMHYRALSPQSKLFKAFLKYTQIYAEKMGEEFTGHFSIDFLVDESASGSGLEGEGKEEKENEKSVDDLMEGIYPIECNPRAHTAAVLFSSLQSEVTDAYLSLLSDSSPSSFSHPQKKEIIIPSSSTPGYYWVGHDLVTRVFLPVLYLLQGKVSISELVASWLEFHDHVLYWKDGTYEIWDPWPFWWLYVVYWPGMFWISIFTRNWWSRCNVSTTKLFRCS